MGASSSHHKAIKRLALLSLSVTAIFGINAAFFLISQAHLNATSEKTEDALALIQAVESDSRYFDARSRITAEQCNAETLEGCNDFLELMLALRNRNSDYIDVLKKSFGQFNIARQIGVLTGINHSIEELASSGFGLPLQEARSRGIKSASEYLRYIEDKGSRNPRLTSELLRVLPSKIREGNQTMRIFAERIYEEYDDYDTARNQVGFFFWLLSSSELIVFIIVTSMDVWNNNAS